jgi:hypothetical protein
LVSQTVELQFERASQPFVALSAGHGVAAKPSLQLEKEKGEQTVREARRGDVRTEFTARLRLLDKIGNPGELRRHHLGDTVTAVLDERQFSYEYPRQSAIALVQRDHRSKEMQHLFEHWPRGHRGERVGDDPAHILAEQQHQQIFLGAGIKEKRANSDVRSRSDFARGGSLEAFAAEEFSRRAFNAVELVALAAFDPAWTFVLHLLLELSALRYEHAHRY